MSRRRDAVVIGGGHNGLVAAAYLARAGLDPLVCTGSRPGSAPGGPSPVPIRVKSVLA